jgi:integrating conjugative element protein (TIGR03757 family)
MKWMAVILLCVLTMPLIAETMAIEIFTLSNHPVAINSTDHQSIDYYTLDLSQQVIEQFNAGLTPNNALARFSAHQAQLQHEFKGLSLIQQYGIKAIPAIVFNHQAIIEGNANLDAAILEYQTWQRK